MYDTQNLEVDHWEKGNMEKLYAWYDFQKKKAPSLTQFWKVSDDKSGYF